MKNHLKGIESVPRYSLIGVTLSIDALDENEIEAWHRSGCDQGKRNSTVTPEFPEATWTLIGYDVSYAFLLSGLTNCGYSNGEIIDFRNQFRSDLNEHHLFSEIKRADDFRRKCNARVKEHAPFYVYGIWNPENKTD